MADASPESSADLWIPSPGRAHGVVLLTHGLNGNPASLDPLGKALAACGLEVFRPCFSGHRAVPGEFLAIEAAHWRSDALRFHALARSRAAELGVPLHHVAYSMSGLIFQALRDELPFDRRVYFAPALALHAWYEPAMWIARAMPWVKFRSRIPGGYSANPVSGFRSAIALHEFHRKRPPEPDLVPTLIWCDPEDELVSGPGLQQLAARSAVWQYRAVSTEGCTLPMRYHHLIIDEPSLGRAEWERVTRETAAFLASDPQSSSL